MGIPNQEFWSGLPLRSPGDLPHPGIEPASPVLTDGFFTTGPPGKPMIPCNILYFIYIYTFPLVSVHSIHQARNSIFGISYHLVQYTVLVFNLELQNSLQKDS